MPAYVIAEHDVHDPAGYDKARPGAAAAIAKHGGRYLTSGLGQAELIEGTQPPKRIVLLEFPDMDAVLDAAKAEAHRQSAKGHALGSRYFLSDSAVDGGRPQNSNAIDFAAACKRAVDSCECPRVAVPIDCWDFRSTPLSRVDSIG